MPWTVSVATMTSQTANARSGRLVTLPSATPAAGTLEVFAWMLWRRSVGRGPRCGPSPRAGRRRALAPLPAGGRAGWRAGRELTLVQVVVIVASPCTTAPCPCADGLPTNLQRRAVLRVRFRAGNRLHSPCRGVQSAGDGVG